MRPDNYVTILGWMVTQLGLSGNELIVYALIYGFSQDENSVFSGTSRYIAEWCNIRKEAALQVLKRLTDNGLLEKREKLVNGVKLYDYVALIPNDTPVRKPHRGGAETTPGGGAETTPPIDNNNIDKIKKRKITPKSPYGEFGKVMLSDKDMEMALEKYGGDMDKLNYAISLLDDYIAQDAKRERRYTNHYAVLTSRSSWVQKRLAEEYTPRRRVETEIDTKVIKVF